MIDFATNFLQGIAIPEQEIVKMLKQGDLMHSEQLHKSRIYCNIFSNISAVEILLIIKYLNGKRELLRERLTLY